MKQLIAGGIGVLSGVILFGFTLVAAAIYALELSSIGYYTQWGLYGSALLAIGIVPLVISAGLFTAGLVLLFKGADKDWKAKYVLAGDAPNEPTQNKENL
ncbi:hypothetical protein [Planococcus dechangensis]|uniref:Uncharacterized protein n=1 Tax=Planococcus dechangensis TaxID=1176255 RepID=A0ABV9MEB9_9BACL